MDFQKLRDSAQTFDPRNDEKSASHRFDELFSWEMFGGFVLGTTASKPLEMVVNMSGSVVHNAANGQPLLYQFPYIDAVKFVLYCILFFVLMFSFIYWANIRDRLQETTESVKEKKESGELLKGDNESTDDNSDKDSIEVKGGRGNESDNESSDKEGPSPANDRLAAVVGLTIGVLFAIAYLLGRVLSN